MTPPGRVTLETTDLGQPRLFLGGQPGPAVSFSQAAGCLWAALAPVGQVGVDAALPSEFEAGYPLARVFRAPELDWARPLCGGDTAGAAALLWALKEAAVKALGVGFHLPGPPGGGGLQSQTLAGRLAGRRAGRADSSGLGPARPPAAGWPWPGIIEEKKRLVWRQRYFLRM